MNLLEGKKLSLNLDGRSILRGIDLNLQQGGMLGLIGPNGAGKTSLLRLLAGLVEADQGEVKLEQQPYHSIKVEQRARKIAYLAQSGTAHWPLRVERLVELGRFPHLGNWQKPTEQDARIIDRILRQTDTEQLRDRTFDTLSGGERARVLLARALAAEPTILLADEPVAALDPSHQLDVMALLSDHCRNGGAVIVVLHDLSLAAHFCDRLQLLLNGESIAVGPPSQILTESHLKQAYHIVPSNEVSTDDSPFPLKWKRIRDASES